MNLPCPAVLQSRWEWEDICNQNVSYILFILWDIKIYIFKEILNIASLCILLFCLFVCYVAINLWGRMQRCTEMQSNFELLLHGSERFLTFPLLIYSSLGTSWAIFHTQSPKTLPALFFFLKFPKKQWQDQEIVTLLWVAVGRQRHWLPSPLQRCKFGMLSLICNLNETASLASYTQGENGGKKGWTEGSRRGKRGKPIPPVCAWAPLCSWEQLM